MIVLNEFQQIIRVNSNLEAEFHTIFQQQDRVALAFLGSRMQLLKDMLSNEKRPLYHAAKIMELWPIETKALAGFIKSRFKKITVSISDDLALKIATRVKGHPDYAQLLCSHILDGLEAKTVSEEFIEQGVSRMLLSLTPSFAGIFEELPLRESQVIGMDLGLPGSSQRQGQAHISSNLVLPIWGIRLWIAMPYSMPMFRPPSPNRAPCSCLVLVCLVLLHSAERNSLEKAVKLKLENHKTKKAAQSVGGFFCLSYRHSTCWLRWFRPLPADPWPLPPALRHLPSALCAKKCRISLLPYRKNPIK